MRQRNLGPKPWIRFTKHVGLRNTEINGTGQ